MSFRLCYYAGLLLLIILLEPGKPKLRPSPLPSRSNETLVPLHSRCKEIAAEPLRLLCSSSYPLEMKIKYKDQMVQAGMPYSVYVPRLVKKPKNFMLTFRPSNVHKCPLIQITYQNQIRCIEMEPVIIPLLNSVVHCFDITVDVIADLVEYCMEHKQGPEWTDDEVELELTMFHYSNLDFESTANLIMQKWQSWTLVVISIIFYIWAIVL